jgi:hypothetical protein
MCNGLWTPFFNIVEVGITLAWHEIKTEVKQSTHNRANAEGEEMNSHISRFPTNLPSRART